MSQKTEAKHVSHNGKNIAYHQEWEFRQEAAIWINGRPVRPNFYPLGTELRNWLLRKGNVWYFTSKEKDLPHAFTNPYTYDGSILSITFGQIINESAAFADGMEPMEPTQAEIKRIRLYTENVAYVARLCEAFIKQLLFCTDFVEGNYRGAALGSLLSKECSGCQSSKEKRHKISLLGSIAHRYGFCGPYEHCLNDHMRIVNRRRDIEAAHSGVAEFRVQSVNESRKQLGEDLTKLGEELIHMLRHISDMEEKMAEELEALISNQTPRARVLIKASASHSQEPAVEDPVDQESKAPASESP
jgi:hypothetical protein